MTHADNVDAGEISHFDRFSGDWWQPAGEFRTLHDINPVRVEFIAATTPLAGAHGVDVGCGGGILTEALAGRGARMLGIDLSEGAIAAARGQATTHRPELHRRYEHCSAEALAYDRAGSFDFVTCLEMLEHVPDPAAVVRACAALVRPGGHVFFSTINRTPKAYALAVLGAEYLLRLLPRGTHDYAKFLRPSELDGFARGAGLELLALRGTHYDPLTRRARLVDDVGVNYLASYVREDEAPA